MSLSPRPAFSRKPLAILLAFPAALALGQERQLPEMVVASETDKPVQQRTELGRLTEYTPLSGAVVSREELEHLQLGNNLLELGKRIPGIAMIRNLRIPDGGKLYTEKPHRRHAGHRHQYLGPRRDRPGRHRAHRGDYRAGLGPLRQRCLRRHHQHLHPAAAPDLAGRHLSGGG